MIYLVIALVVLGALILAVLIETRSTVHLVWITPLCLGLFTGTYLWAKSMFGYPTDVYEDGMEFTHVAHWVPPSEDKIFVWVILAGEMVPKAFQLPYDKEQHKGLQAMGEKMKQGAMFKGTFHSQGSQGESGGDEAKGNEEGTLRSSGGMMSFHELTPEHFLPSKNDFYGTE